MTSAVSNITSNEALMALIGELSESARTPNVSNETASPPTNANTVGASILNQLNLPTLPASMGGLSLDTLMKAVADDVRRNSIQGSVDTIENQGKAIDAQNLKELEEIQKQITQQQKQSFWSKFLKVFKIIGAVVGAIASVATTAVGAVTGNAALIAAGIFGAIATIDSIASLASDGKVSISAGFTELGKKLGMSDSAAQWFGFGMNMAVMVAGIAVSFGAAAASNSAKAVQTAADISDKAAQGLSALQKVSTAANIGQGGVGAASGVGSAALAVVEYRLANIEADKIDIAAILEQLRSDFKASEDLLKSQMETAENIMNSVMDIVSECSQTNTAILTAAPSVA